VSGISKSERFFILALVILGVFGSATSYYKKIFFAPPVVQFKGYNPAIIVNINTASSEELERLPGIGPVLAQRIVAYRKEKGIFTDVEELRHVKGISKAKFEDIKGLVTLRHKVGEP
jgi:competence ComEA-like helix-hairpin-helix protein